MENSLATGFIDIDRIAPADTDTFDPRRFIEFISTADPDVHHPRSRPRIGEQRSSMEYIHVRKSRLRVLERDAEKTHRMKSELEHAKKQYMGEKAEKEQLQKDLGESLKHECVTTPNKSESLQQWNAVNLRELESVKEQLKQTKLQSKQNVEQARRETPQVESCPICYECPPQVTTGCGHNFCKGCFDQHVRISEVDLRCPMCRQDLQPHLEGFVSLVDI